MIHTYDLPNGGKLMTGDGGKELIDAAITEEIKKWIDYDEWEFHREYMKLHVLNMALDISKKLQSEDKLIKK